MPTNNNIQHNLVEVVIGIQFQPFPINAMIAGKICQHFEADFPDYRELEALPPSPMEESALPSFPQQQIIFGAMPNRRFWLINNETGYLLQIQHDRFLLNWRMNTKNKISYPGHIKLRDVFLEKLEILRPLVGDSLKKDVQWEMTYINHFTYHQSSGNKPVSDILFEHSIFANHDANSDLSQEISAQSASYKLNSDKGFNGRIYANVNPFIASNGQNDVNLRMELTFRGNPLSFTDDAKVKIEYIHRNILCLYSSISRRIGITPKNEDLC